MQLNVKNTILRSLANALAPHYCVSCDRVGGVLCECCREYYIEQLFEQCLVCGLVTSGAGACGRCRPQVAYSRGWAATERDEVIGRLIDEYKWRHNAAALDACATLLDDAVPILPPDTIVVPVPTIAPHVRQRGFAHAERIAAAFARQRRLPYRAVVTRRANYVQRGSTRRARQRQASESYDCTIATTGGRYVVIDDVMTTGATLDAVARVLRQRGAEEVYVAVVARQPLDDAA